MLCPIDRLQMHRDLYEAIGVAIRKRRESIGMTQATLAESAGLSRTSVTNIERGGQALLVHQLLELARVLRVRPADILPDQIAAREIDSARQPTAEVKVLLDRLEARSTRRGSS
jgi:transcriptional regulator with XRE-family HTH domain